MKICVYLLIVQFSLGALMPRTDFGQLSSIAYLVDHYKLHLSEAKASGERFTAWDFIYNHYVSPDNHTHDTPVDHNKLPFKSVISSINFCKVSPEFSVEISNISESVCDQIRTNSTTFIDRIHTKDLLQPPNV